MLAGTSTPSCFAMREMGEPSMSSATLTTSNASSSALAFSISMAASFSSCTDSGLAVPASGAA